MIETVDEVQAVVSIPTEGELKELSEVVCPECGRQMSAKTLRYSHGPNCVAKKQKQSPHDFLERNLIEDVVENEVQRRMNKAGAVRAARRQQMVQKLMQHAF